MVYFRPIEIFLSILELLHLNPVLNFAIGEKIAEPHLRRVGVRFWFRLIFSLCLDKYNKLPMIRTGQP